MNHFFFVFSFPELKSRNVFETAIEATATGCVFSICLSGKHFGELMRLRVFAALLVYQNIFLVSCHLTCH